MNLLRVSQRFIMICSEIDIFIREAVNIRNSNAFGYTAYTAYAIVKLHDAWASKCREIILKSSTGGYKTATGRTLNRVSALGRSENPVNWLRKNWTTARTMPIHWEPDWHIPDQAIRTARLLNIQNFDTVSNALGAITVIEQLRCIRNVIVHSLPFPFVKYRETISHLGFPKSISPFELVYLRMANTGPMVIDYWIEQMQLCISAAIK